MGSAHPSTSGVMATFSIEGNGPRRGLTGEAAGDRLVVNLLHRDRDDFLLVSRGFHWVSEVPYNR